MHCPPAECLGGARWEMPQAAVPHDKKRVPVRDVTPSPYALAKDGLPATISLGFRWQCRRSLTADPAGRRAYRRTRLKEQAFAPFAGILSLWGSRGNRSDQAAV